MDDLSTGIPRIIFNSVEKRLKVSREKRIYRKKSFVHEESQNAGKVEITRQRFLRQLFGDLFTASQ